jgi:hypothetical protein
MSDGLGRSPGCAYLPYPPNAPSESARLERRVQPYLLAECQESTKTAGTEQNHDPHYQLDVGLPSRVAKCCVGGLKTHGAQVARAEGHNLRSQVVERRIT